jgi:hypothetical protein
MEKMMEKKEKMEKKDGNESLGIISSKELEEYSKNIEEYYLLKQKYDKRTKKIIDKYILEMKKSKTPLSKIKQQIKKQKLECIHCFQEGGTLFYSKEGTLFAKCGSKTNPCSLKIEIQLMKGSSLLEKIAEFRQEMTNIELEINHFKNKKTHFKEDFSETTYENMKKKLEDATKKYQTMVARFNTNYMLNEKEQQELFELQISYDDLLQRANAIFAEYMKTKNISILGDLVAFQENEIKPIEDKMDEKKCAKRVMKIGSVEDQLITYKVPEANYDFLESGTFAVKHFHI